MPHTNGHRSKKKIRYAVVGLGYIGQIAVLPAFAHAKENSVLNALVSGDAVKLKKLSREYEVPHSYSYDEYDECLASGNIDAVYIALPNNMHRDFAVKAAEAGIHCLCEKPLALTESDCLDMIDAAEQNDVRLMTAYRLHMDEPNLKAISIANSGKIGELRLFNSVFSMQVKRGNIRLDGKQTGGTLYDLGIYCINAARYIFKSEPFEVMALSANSGDERFREIDEMTSAILRFPGERLATVTSSFGMAAEGWYEVVGTKGSLCLENGYEYAQKKVLSLTVNEKTVSKNFSVTDQFAPELVYFSDCILNNKIPEPSGEEGLADVRIIEAIYQSAKHHAPVNITPVRKIDRPDVVMEQRKPKVEKPELIHAAAPSD